MDGGLSARVAPLYADALGVMKMFSLRAKTWWLVLNAVLALSLAVAFYWTLQNYVAEQSASAEQQRDAQMIWLLVYSRDIEAGQQVAIEDFQQRKFPPDYVTDDWLLPQDVSVVVGSHTQQFVAAGEPVSLAHLGTLQPTSFSDVLAPGEFAVTATVSIEQLHHGLVEVGNFVTLVGQDFRSEQSRLTAIPNVEVLALDSFTDVGWQEGLASTLTFRFSAEQAYQFEQLRQSQFSIWLQRSEHFTDLWLDSPNPIIYLMEREGG